MLSHVGVVEDICDYTCGFDACESEVEALMLEGQFVVIHAATFQNSGVEVTDVDFLVGRGDIE